MIYPIFALVLLTFIVGVITLSTRFKSVLNRTVKIKYYRNMQGQEVPEFVTRTTRCFNNLFEVPVLFYAVTLMMVATGHKSELSLLLAWCFVFSRVVQAMVHLTYNNVIHRMIGFWAGFIIVIIMWLELLFTAVP
ncbi:hypothetical protein E8M12_06220 [Thalassotalea mangrovi]|uniref:MAPEG family protein n=2 Tax=Thalassotalea mangrovi TaxID=2572245 RepID=A0A4U1B6H6_9GAMM|nr:hypothetical protein E8M12_06220 [Thalassotalea mangrovi]